MHVFYSDIAGSKMVILNQEESRHCVKVLRLKQGDEVVVTDGSGRWLLGRLAEANPRACLVSPGEIITIPARQPQLHIAIAPTKNIDRFEWFLEKATECGIEQVTPVFCEKSERNVIKPDRLEKLMVAAMKQSLRAWLPTLNPAVRLKDFLKRDIPGAKMIAHCGPGERKVFRDVCTAGQHAVILIGPEGDFTEREVVQALGAGYQPISFGHYRLRTETAGLVACVEFNILNGEL